MNKPSQLIRTVCDGNTVKLVLSGHLRELAVLSYRCVTRECVTRESREATQGEKKKVTVAFSYNEFVPT